MKKRITNWFKGHKVLRAVLPGSIALLLMVAVITPAMAVAPTIPNIAGTYDVTCSLKANFLDNSSATRVKTGTLTIVTNTATANGVISSASLALTDIGTVALTGFVGAGTRPQLSLVGADGSINVIVNARVTVRSGAVSTIRGRIEGWQGHYGAELGNSTDAGAGTWDSTTVHGGSAAALLTQSGAGDTVYVQFVPPAGFKISDLDDITSGWGFYQLFQLGKSAGAQYELRFVAPTNVNPDGAGHVDITVLDSPPITGTGEWANWPLTSESVALYYGNDPYNGTPFDWHDEGAMTLAEVEDAINAEDEMTEDAGGFSCSDWTLARVRIELWGGAARTSYIDDVSLKIGRKTYTFTFEPVFFSGGFSAR